MTTHFSTPEEHVAAYAEFYEAIAWVLNDLMDDIEDFMERGLEGDARDVAGTTRALFQAFPDQPDDRTYEEKSRLEVLRVLERHPEWADSLGISIEQVRQNDDQE